MWQGSEVRWNLELWLMADVQGVYDRLRGWWQGETKYTVVFGAMGDDLREGRRGSLCGDKKTFYLALGY